MSENIKESKVFMKIFFVCGFFVWFELKSNYIFCMFVDYDNNFVKMILIEINFFGEEYDFLSIMYYVRNMFLKLSDLDILVLKMLIVDILEIG